MKILKRTHANHKPSLRRLLVESLEARRLLSADWRNPVDAIDVNRDGLVTPLDALVVLNEIARRNRVGINELEPRPVGSTLPFYDVDGNGEIVPLDALRVLVGIRPLTRSEYVLRESSSAAAELSVTIGLGGSEGTRTYQFDIDASFDSDSQSNVQDALAVYLVDPESPQSTVLDRGEAGTALFVLSGQRADFVPGMVRFDGQTVSVDLTDLGDLDTGQLVFQLISQNDRSDTSITIRPHSNDVDREGVIPQRFILDSQLMLPGSSINFAELTPAAVGQFEVDLRNVRFDRTTGRYDAELQLINRGEAVGRDVAIAFPGLPEGAVLEGAAGVTSDGQPLLSLRPAIAAGGLGKGQRSEPVRVSFTTQALSRFRLATNVYVGQPNRAPVFPPLAPITIRPGARVDVELGATDPDGDRVTYSLRGANGLTMRLSGSGVLSLMPTPNQIGNHTLTVIASDGRLSTERDLQISVLADPLASTRVSGQVLDVDGTPLQGLQVEVGGVQGLTLADGRFTLDLGSGPLAADTLRVRGETFTGADSYPFIAEKLPFMLGREIFQGFDNVIARPIYLPKLNAGQPVNPASNTSIEATLREGHSPVRVDITAGSLLTQQGTPFTGSLSITEVPVDLTPAALPPNLLPDFLVTIQPGEMVFSTPAPLSFPNTGGWEAGTAMDLWSINPVTGEFEIVGDMAVSTDGTTIETTSGGILNSSWHFAAPLPSGPKDPPPPNCNQCKATDQLTSEVELQTGALREHHTLPTYQSLGTTRGVSLEYDSGTVNLYRQVNFSYDDVPAVAGPFRLTSRLKIHHESTTIEVPGAEPQRGLTGGEHYWRLPASGGDINASIGFDATQLATGIYDYTLDSGFLRFGGERGQGTLSTTQGMFVHVNATESPFGAGWAIAGLQQILEDSRGRLLLLDGDHLATVYFPSPSSDGSYEPVAEDFSTLTKLVGGGFRRVLNDQTEFLYDSDGRLECVTDRNNNSTTYTYGIDGQLETITDPVGLITTFTYANGLLVSITDPAARTTNFLHDSSGNLIRITDPDGSARSFDYDFNHRMVAEADKRGHREEVVYDDFGSVVEAVRKDGSVLRVSSLAASNRYRFSETTNFVEAPMARTATPAVSVDANGNPVVIGLDGLGQSSNQSDSQGRLGNTIRNELNLVSSNIDARGFVTNYTYDEQGNILSIQDTIGGLETVVLAHNYSDNAIYLIDPLTGEVSSLPSTDRILYDIAYDSVLGVYAINSAGQVHQLDTSNGSTTRVGNFSISNANGLAFSEEGQLFAASNSLFQIDLDNGTSTRIGTGFGGFVASGDIEFDDAGNLYMTANHSGNSSRLVKINVETGIGTLIGTSLGSHGRILGLAYLPELGMLGFSETGKAISIDLDTGIGTEIFSLDRTLVRSLGGAARFETPSEVTATRSFTYDQNFNQMTSSTDERGKQTIYAIDPANGNTLSRRQVVGQIDSPDNGETDDLITNYSYNAFGLIRTITDPLGRVTAYEYNSLGRLSEMTVAAGTSDEATMRYEYDAAGNQTAMIDGNGNRTEYQYDLLNRVVRTIEADPDGAGPLTSPTTTFNYDAAGYLQFTTDANGNVSTSVFDEMNRLVESIGPDPDGSGPLAAPVTTYGYDSVGNLTSLTDPNGNTSSYSYDGRNRRIQMVDPDGGVTRFGYDADNNLSMVNDPVGNITQFRYDARSRLVEEVDPLGSSIRYSYDAADNLIQKTDRNGRITKYSYDDINRLIKEEWVGGNEAIVNTIDYSYDATGNLVSISDNDSTLRHTHDHRDRVSKVSLEYAVKSYSWTVEYGYDAVSNPTSIDVSIDQQKELQRSLEYDALNRIDSLTLHRLGTPRQFVDFTYNQLGQYKTVRHFASELNSLASVVTSYVYDEQNRLVVLTHTSGNGNAIANFNLSYDTSGRIVEVADRTERLAFEYDDRNQLISASRVDDAFADETFRYDAAGNRVESSLHGDGYETGTGNRLLTDGTFSYEYDSEGNLISRINVENDESHHYSWDHRNRLTAYWKMLNGAEVRRVEFTYDPSDRRISRETVGELGSLQLYAYDHADVIYVGTGENRESQFYMYGPGVDNLLAQYSDDTPVEWVLKDHQGSVRAVATEIGDDVQYVNYDAFGTPLSNDMPSVFGFASREWESDLELYNNRFRLYDPSIGRFISNDPSGFSAGDANLYRYVKNGVVNKVDPMGLAEETISGRWVSRPALDASSINVEPLGFDFSDSGRTKLWPPKVKIADAKFRVEGNVTWKIRCTVKCGVVTTHEYDLGPTEGVSVSVPVSVPVWEGVKGAWKLLCGPYAWVCAIAYYGHKVADFADEAETAARILLNEKARAVASEIVSQIGDPTNYCRTNRR